MRVVGEFDVDLDVLGRLVAVEVKADVLISLLRLLNSMTWSFSVRR